MPTYAYAYMVDLVPVRPVATTVSDKDLADTWRNSLNEAGVSLTKKIDDVEMRGWEAVSHSVVDLGDKLMVTVLVRRETDLGQRP